MPAENVYNPQGAGSSQSTAAGVGAAAADQIDQRRDAAAGGMQSAAASLHRHADDLPGGQRVAGFAHSAADKLSLTADYVRNHDLNAMVEDVKSLVKKNPVPAMAGAAVLGFLLAKAFSSRD